MNDDLKYPLDHIPEEGLKIGIEVKADLLDVEGGNWPPLSGVRLEGTLERTGDQEAVFGGRVFGTFLVECHLGLAQVKFPVEEELTVYFQPAYPGETSSGDEVELGERDLEVYYIENDGVDLLNPLRDQLGLAIPMQPQCPDKCKGEDPDLCRRLREGEGVGSEIEGDPRWTVLKEWGKVES